MAKTKDPFAGAGLSSMAGLDQRLFDENAASESRSDVRPAGRKSVRPSRRRNERSIEPTDEGTDVPQQVSPPPSRPPMRGRILRRPYDFFEGQVQWLNRKRLEIEEQYGVRVPANAMVQLAVDLLIEDFERRGEKSQLIGTLVLRKQPVIGHGTSNAREAAEAKYPSESDG